MEVIEVDNHNKLPREVTMQGYINTTPESAAFDFRKKYETEVKRIYKVVRPNGRFTLYIPIAED